MKMSQTSIRGEKIYECVLDITGVTDYGLALDAVLSGKDKVPPQGARFDVAFEGNATGRLSGQVHGTDYLRMRADGRADLDLRITFETQDGCRIALTADGVAVPRADEPIIEIVENAVLTTAAANYAWVLSRQVRALGTVNLATGKIHVEGYLQ
jgi:hypothetical protein